MQQSFPRWCLKDCLGTWIVMHTDFLSSLCTDSWWILMRMGFLILWNRRICRSFQRMRSFEPLTPKVMHLNFFISKFICWVCCMYDGTSSHTRTGYAWNSRGRSHLCGGKFTMSGRTQEREWVFPLFVDSFVLVATCEYFRPSKPRLSGSHLATGL